METIVKILSLGRGRIRSFALVAVLVSLGTAASLFEPWIYRSIVDDVAGVFVPPGPILRMEERLQALRPRARPAAPQPLQTPLQTPPQPSPPPPPPRAGETLKERRAQEKLEASRAEEKLEGIHSSFKHLKHSGRRIFRAPLKVIQPEEMPKRALPHRTAPQAAATVVMGAILLVVTRLLSELCRMMGDNRSTVAANDIERNFILRTFRHVLRLPLGFFTRRASGAVARQIDQSDHVAPVFTAFAHEIWPDFFSLVAILVIMSRLNWELALVFFVAVPLYALVTWRMTRRLETHLEQYYDLWDEVSSHIQQTVAGIKTVLTHGAADHEYAKLDRASTAAFASYVERNRMQNRYNALQEAIVTFAKAGALVLGGMKALEHQLTPGDVVMFVAYLDQVFHPIENLTELYASLQEHASSLKRAQRLLEVPEAPEEGLAPFAPGRGEVEFADVRFGYAPERPVLDGVSFRVGPGEHVGLVGPSGAGKTTVTDLLVGLYRPGAGEIRVDGQSVAGVSPTSLRAAIRGVAADGMLFRMSIADNIRYGRFAADDAEVEEAARWAGLGPLLARLPEGLRTPIGERGVELSAGERQRVLLARAFVARPAILVLDEATANLDFKTEAAVKEALSVLAKGRTTLLVAHRRSMLTDVDRVLVLRGGKIEQDGPPDELARVDGYFRQMVLAGEGKAGGA